VQLSAQGERVPGPEPEEPSLESTATLLERIRAGDLAARERLLGRYLPALKRWAHGRLPPYSRDLTETDDLVQMTLLSTLNHLEGFDSRREGAFLAYLRRILLNKLRDEIRRTRRRPGKEALAEDLPERNPSPLENAIGMQILEAYETALARLPENQQEAVILKIEMGFSNPEIATAIGSPSPNAARMLVVRGLERLAAEMNDGRQTERE
jgi:RNA polymerase sigma-70 factor (ECF subfamily)